MQLEEQEMSALQKKISVLICHLCLVVYTSSFSFPLGLVFDFM